MDVFDDIIGEYTYDEAESRKLLKLLSKHVPDGRFQLVSDQGMTTDAEQIPRLAPESRDALVDRARSENDGSHVEHPAGSPVHARRVNALESTLIFALPGEGAGSQPKNYGTAAVELCVELFALQEALQESRALIATQSKQVNRKVGVLEEKYQDLLAEAESANLAKREFLANMSPEIRTPLNGIIGMAELATDTNLDDNQKNLVLTINREADFLLKVINDILDFSKIEAGKIEIEAISFGLRNTIEDIASTFSYRANQKELRFSSSLAPDVPPYLIGDPGRLKQILVNLLANALKFTAKGEIALSCTLAKDLGDEIMVRFSVKDTGIGIPKDKQQTIFEDFSQADGSTTRKYGGTGLGISISKQLAELMGGEIGVDSEAGEGSTFWFTAVFSKETKQKNILSKQHIDLNDLRVLVVDDNHTNRFILMENLRSWGCRPVEASGGKEALSILGDSVSSDEPFRLILTDFQMPLMNGFDLSREIRAMEPHKDIPIIVLTSAGNKGDGENSRDIGIDGYLTKPLRREDMHRAIESVLILSKRKDRESRRLVTRHTIAEAYGKDIRILLVEDYPTNQMVAMGHLHTAGYQVDLSQNGQQAVTAFKKKQYDLVLMDIQMPVMDGYEATRQIREHESQSAKPKAGSHHPDTQQQQAVSDKETSPPGRVPIVAMTAHALEGYRERCLEAGMDDYIAKPLRRHELLAMVDRWSREIHNCGVEIDDSGTAHGDPKPLPILNHPSKAVSPMDYEAVLEDFEGDKELLAETTDLFLATVSNQLGMLRQAISDNNADLVRLEAHSIKGGAANLTANELSRIASELEKIGKSGILEKATAALGQLEEEFSLLQNYAENK
ncbi:MAG: response regulator [Desulfobacterales bacterium]